MVRRILIVGAGGFGREVAAWLRHSLPSASSGGGVTITEFAGFVDDRPDCLDRFSTGATVVGSLAEVIPEPMWADHDFLIAIGDPIVRARIGQQLLAAGRRLHTLIHPTAVLGERIEIGAGSIVCPNTTLTCDIRLGLGVIVNAHSSVGHDVCVGDWCTLSGHCEITGGCELGSGVFLGCGARVIPSRRIGDRCRIGAGAVVMSHLQASASVYGNPARPL